MDGVEIHLKTSKFISFYKYLFIRYYLSYNCVIDVVVSWEETHLCSKV